MDSPLVNLVQGEGGVLLSARERMLLEYALDLFGDPLSQFLLSGIGEEAEERAWRFTVTFGDERGAAHSREISVEPDDFPHVINILPRRREPLVILALLHLLIEDHKLSSSSISYKLEKVLHLLGWEDTEETRLAIDEAVERYVRLSYRWGLNHKELTERKLSFYKGESRFISGYRRYEAEEGEEVIRMANKVEFCLEFVEGLTRRAIFNVDWNSATGLTREVLS